MAKAPKSGMCCDDEEMDMGSNDSSSEDGESEVEISIKKSAKGGMIKKAKGGVIKASGKGYGSAVKGRKFQGTY